MGTRKEELLEIERQKTIIENQEKLASELKDIGRELLIQRKANEAFVYGEEAEDNEDVDLDEVPLKEVE